MTQIEEYLARYEWAGERLDEDVWRCTFSGGDEADYDLYVMVSERWIHLAVSPLISRPRPENTARLNSLLLRLNQSLSGVALAVDDDGDVNLVAALAAIDLGYSQFATTLDTLAEVTADLATELERIGADVGYHSARFG